MASTKSWRQYPQPGRPQLSNATVYIRAVDRGHVFLLVQNGLVQNRDLRAIACISYLLHQGRGGNYARVKGDSRIVQHEINAGILHPCFLGESPLDERLAGGTSHAADWNRDPFQCGGEAAASFASALFNRVLDIWSLLLLLLDACWEAVAIKCDSNILRGYLCGVEGDLYRADLHRVNRTP